MKSTLTPEQIQARLGMFTGSEIYKLMGVKGIGKTGETYIYEKAAEFLTKEPIKPEFSSAATSWGVDHEPEAKLYFEYATGCRVHEVGTLTNSLISGTPDGVLHDGVGFEIKCPYNSANHLKYLSFQSQSDLKENKPEYYWQCVTYMWLLGIDMYKFCSYDPRFKENQRMLILNMQLIPSELELLKSRVQEAELLKQNIISKI